MAHPFFDSMVYPWARPEAVALRDVLAQAIRDPDEIVRRFQVAGGDTAVLTLHHQPRAQWHEVLEQLARVHRLRHLCDQLQQDPGFAQVAEVQAALRAVVDAQHAVEAQQLGDDHVLVLDRQDLRRKVEAIEPPMSPLKVLLVRGEQKTGKSRARFVFGALAKERGAEYVYLADGVVATVEEVVDDLMRAVAAGDERIELDLTTPDATYRAICVRLLKLAERNDRRVWVAIDDLGLGADGAPLLDPTIRAFCDQFALMMLRPAFAERFRLLLIHYPPGPVPTKWKPELWTEDVTTEDDVQPDHVAAFLRTWAAGRQLVLRDPDIEQAVADVFARCDALSATGAPRLQRLHDAVQERLAQLAGGVPPGEGDA